MEEKRNRLKTPLYASLSLAFASFGDAFLYPFLPVNSISVGVPVVWIGILLSVNRFVRIISNSWMVHLFSKYGLRFITIIAVLLAITSTAGYAFANTIFLWLIFRIAWGVSFSAMRISTLGYALQHSRQGFSLGLTRGVQESGPMIALLLAPVLLTNLSTSTIFLLLATISLPAVYFAWALPTFEDKTPSVSGKTFLQFPSVLNMITFATAFLIDGIIIVVLGILFLHHKESITVVSATTMAALYLGYRRVCLVLFSPAGGWMADKVGISTMFNASLAFVIAGLVMLSFGWIEAGAIIIFTFYSIHAAITPGNASYQQSHPLSAVSANVTWRDIGAAVGTLAGGVLITSDHLTTILIIAIFSLVLLLLIHLGTVQKSLKLLLWK
jgi:DHA1 family multidrug resistance protein-like MFS transporter